MTENADETEHEELNDEKVLPWKLKKCCANCQHYGTHRTPSRDVWDGEEEATCPVCGKPAGLHVASCPSCGAEFEDPEEDTPGYRCLRTRFPDLSPDLETYNARLKQDKKTFKKTGKHTVVKREFCERFVMVLPHTPEEKLEEKIHELRREIEADLERAVDNEMKTALELEYQRLLRVKAGDEPYEKPLERVLEAQVKQVKVSPTRNITRRGDGWSCSLCDYTSLSREAAKKHFKRKHREKKISPIPPGETPQPDRKVEGRRPWEVG